MLDNLLCLFEVHWSLKSDLSRHTVLAILLILFWLLHDLKSEKIRHYVLAISLCGLGVHLVILQ